jgi:5'-methylthioadenosine phosphorylase
MAMNTGMHHRRQRPLRGESMALKIGIIGGSGLYEMDGLTDVRDVTVETPFGSPSDAIVNGRLGSTELFFLPRHGRGHRLLPSELPFRANLWALKHLGVERVIAVSAVGSLREDIAPGHLVVPDQFIDRTFNRVGTFFGNGIVAHVAFGDPVCPVLSASVVGSARRLGATVHAGGTYVCMEGPQFSTRAESELYRSWGASIIGMTNLQEAKLAREAEMCFATLALATDYDCWKQDEHEVDIAAVLAVMHANVAMAKKVVHDVVPTLAPSPGCGCGRALENAIITDRARIPERVKRDLAPIIGRHL